MTVSVCNINPQSIVILLIPSKNTTTMPRSLNLPFSPLHFHHQFQLRNPHYQSLAVKPATLSVSPLHSNHRRIILLRATENGAQTGNEAEIPATTPEVPPSEVDRLSEVGEEIKKAMKERAKGGGGGGVGEFWNGVVEEIGQIEWPQFGKVLGTTGVVLAVIAGSSVVLLTLNAVLAELSDQVFVGKGVQDFFAG